ncbi:MAG: transposase [Prolixibacteraceae bacterium]|nr:transposase [Prolixibacteraceae bacterium]
MKPRKEAYRQKLPHFQQPGQWYSVTCILKGAIPKGSFEKYQLKLRSLKERLNSGNFESMEHEANVTSDYRIAQYKYRLAHEKKLHILKTKISLTKTANLKALTEALKYWEGKRLTSHTWCIMPNHFHWVLTVFETDENEKPVFLQDIMHSVKLFTAHKINTNENRSGSVWEHESFETNIRNEQHFYNVCNYVVNNPVAAGFVKNRHDWPGTYIEPGLLSFL